MLHYLPEEIPWPGKDSTCLESSNTSLQPTDGQLPPTHLSRHAHEPPDGCNDNDSNGDHDNKLEVTTATL